VRTFFGRGRGGLYLRTSALFDAKNFGFFELYGVSERSSGEGFSQCGHFSDKGGRGSIFRDFVWTSFIDRPLGKIFSTFSLTLNVVV